LGFSQTKKIQIIHSDNTFTDEIKYPGAVVALGNVVVEHEGAVLSCKQALIYQESNIIKAFGDVLINQGDTLTQSSKYVDYNGNSKVAKSWGKVVLKDKEMTLVTDTLRFDRSKQLLYYDDFATIDDRTNTLKSQIGKYYLKEDKFQAMSKVVITNPENTVTSEHLDYYTNTGYTYFFGPSTVKDSVNTLYCENGFHNSRAKISHFSKNAKITYKDRIIEGDSLYYDEKSQYATATGNITVTDTINNTIVKGQYSEYFEAKDSVYIVGKPYAVSLIEKDSMFIHGDTLMVTGKKEERILRAYHHVKFFKNDIQGKCDSLYTNEKIGITKMYRRPILWNEENQITGDTIHFLSNPETQKIDSLKVYNNSFVISKDSTGGFSQIKGKMLFGKFVKDTLDNVLIQGNGQMINYSRDEKNELIGITKISCSDLSFIMLQGKLNNVKFLTKPDGKTYPPSKFPKEEDKLPGFIWRENERPLNKEDIFKRDEGDDELIQEWIKREEKFKKDALEAAELEATKASKKEKKSSEIEGTEKEGKENDSNKI
jgi:lipopolysaccharide export system protein LptA